MTILQLNAHLKNHIIVIPVVCFISDPTIIDALVPSPDEVDHIFSHPLKGCHEGILEGEYTEGLVKIGGEWWPHEQEFHSWDMRIGATGGYCMHRFRTTHSPIKGLTSDVLINTATIAYGSPPHFERFAPNQPPFSTVIANVVLELPGVLESEKGESLAEKSLKEGRVLEWGGTEPGSRYRSGETWHEKA